MKCRLPGCNVDHEADKDVLKEHNRRADQHFNNSSSTENIERISDTSNSFVVTNEIDGDPEDYYYKKAKESLEDIDLNYGKIYYEGYEPSGGTTGAEDFLTEYAASRCDGYPDTNRVIVKFQIPGENDDTLEANKNYLEDLPVSKGGIKGEVNGDSYTYTFDNFEHLKKNKSAVEEMSNMITSTHDDYPVFSDEYYNNVTGGHDEGNAYDSYDYDEDEIQMKRDKAYENSHYDFYSDKGRDMLANAVKEKVESTGHTFNRDNFDKWYDSYEAESARQGYEDANGSYEMFFPDEDTGETVIQERNFNSFFNKHGDDYVRGYMSSDPSIIMEGLRRNPGHKEFTADDLKGSESWTDEDRERFFNQR